MTADNARNGGGGDLAAGLAPPPAWQDPEPKPVRKKPAQREHAFQAWCDRFIDRVVLPPMFTTGIDHAHTSMRNIGRRATLQGRGVKFGIPDVFVAQAGRTVWLELKRGSSVTPAQAALHEALRRAGQCVAVCQTMQDVLHAIRAAGFTLHGNAAALADEYEARVGGQEKAPARPKRPGGKRPQPKAARGGMTSADLMRGGW